MNTFKRKALFAAVLAGLALSGCGTFGPSPLLADPFVKNDIASAAYNLNEAVKAGMLPANDPAVGCLAAVAAKADAPTFEPKYDGLVSAGSVAYIAAQVAKKGIQIAPECEALVGRVTIDGVKAARRAVPFLR